MSDSVRASFVNLKEFEAQLKRLEEAPAEHALVTAAKAGAIIIRDAAATKAPKRADILARSIHIEVLESSRHRAWVAIGTYLSYARIHEFGGIIKPKDPTGWLRFRTYDGEWHTVKLVHMPARPYMRPAWDENIDRAVTEMGQVLKAQIERAAR